MGRNIIIKITDELTGIQTTDTVDSDNLPSSALECLRLPVDNFRRKLDDHLNNLKMFLLSTNDPAYISTDSEKIRIVDSPKKHDYPYKGMHLYIVSTEDINSNDYFLIDSFESKLVGTITQQYKDGYIVGTLDPKTHKKIIASTDSSITPNNLIPINIMTRYMHLYKNGAVNDIRIRLRKILVNKKKINDQNNLHQSSIPALPIDLVYEWDLAHGDVQIYE